MSSRLLKVRDDPRHAVIHTFTPRNTGAFSRKSSSDLNPQSACNFRCSTLVLSTFSVSLYFNTLLVSKKHLNRAVDPKLPWSNSGREELRSTGRCCSGKTQAGRVSLDDGNIKSCTLISLDTIDDVTGASLFHLFTDDTIFTFTFIEMIKTKKKT